MFHELKFYLLHSLCLRNSAWHPGGSQYIIVKFNENKTKDLHLLCLTMKLFKYIVNFISILCFELLAIDKDYIIYK